MKKSLKLIIMSLCMVVIAVTLTIGISGCGKEEEPVTTPTTEMTEKAIDEYTLTTREAHSGIEDEGNELVSIEQDERIEVLTGYSLD